MRPPILGSLLHAALVVGSAAQPRPPAQHARPSLHDPLLVDPGGVAAEHEHGLRPHHSSGAAEDPLLFRHRYQHHDAASDRLVYYQYEAKRHPHVVMLEDIGVNKCEASAASEARGGGLPWPSTRRRLHGRGSTAASTVAPAAAAGAVASGPASAQQHPGCGGHRGRL